MQPMRRLRSIRMPLDQSCEANEITAIREKWKPFMVPDTDLADEIWEYYELLHMWELCLKWRSPKTIELTPLAMEVVAEIDETLRSITESKSREMYGNGNKSSRDS